MYCKEQLFDKTSESMTTLITSPFLGPLGTRHIVRGLSNMSTTFGGNFFFSLSKKYYIPVKSLFPSINLGIHHAVIQVVINLE